VHIAIIPARDGSKSIIHKNLQLLGRHSLIERAIITAERAKFFDKIYLTTDIMYEPPESVTFIKRSPILCTDTALMCNVVLNVIEKMNVPNDATLWLIQPTTPFREVQDFHNILEIMREDQFKSCISFKQCDDDHPDRTYTITKNGVKPLHKTNFKPRQQLIPAYRRNGGFYVFNCGDFISTGEFYTAPCFGYIMDTIRSTNIDTELDLFHARCYIEKGKYVDPL